MNPRTAILLLCFVCFSANAAADPVAMAASVRAEIDALYPDLEALYIDLHQNPELSLQEKRTAATMAERLRALGFNVSTGIGGHGVVGVLRNGAGPVVMIRTELDALPIEEKTGLPYASRVKATDESGVEVPVMHACGHDIHMTALVGTATILSRMKNQWQGTVVLVGQPAEERLKGALAMLDAGLFSRFPRPDVALALHQFAFLPAGKIGFASGFALANADALDLTIYGRGGHGAYPHTTVDPIVIAARTVLALQTIVARENNPADPAVVTVGSIHGGSKHNIIPDEVRMQLTVRSYKDEVHKRLLAAIERIAKAEALAAGAPREPTLQRVEGTRALYNDPAVGDQVLTRLRRSLGDAAVVDVAPVMGSEDFSEFVSAGVPGVFLWIGAAERVKYDAAQAGGPPLQAGHSPYFSPDHEPTLRTAILAETLAALELLSNTK